VFAILAVGCAPRSGWVRTDQRTCAPDGPPRVCVDDDPDRQLVVRAGGAALVPGECMVAPRGRGGPLRVDATDGRTGTTTSRWLGVRRGKITRVALGERKLAVVGRTGCP